MQKRISKSKIKKGPAESSSAGQYREFRGMDPVALLFYPRFLKVNILFDFIRNDETALLK